MDIVFDSHCSTEYCSTELYTPQGAEKVRIDIGPMTRGTDGYCV